jgi:hypothetical protein
MLSAMSGGEPAALRGAGRLRRQSGVRVRFAMARL